MKSEVTRILRAIESGNRMASSELLPLVYDELKRIATAKMRSEKSDQTLQPTALVHEAFLRLVGEEDWKQWDGKGHFFAAASEAMRRILIEQARRKKTAKRGGSQQRVEMEDAFLVSDDKVDELLDLEAALQRLAQLDPGLVRLVELRYFTGLSIEQTADVLGVSERTIKRNWAYARAWLQDEIRNNLQS